MSLLYPIRKPCPHCRRPMKLVQDARVAERYVCPECEDDPLHDPAARKWVESPLKPPTRL